MRPKIIKHRGRWKSAEKIQSNRNDVGSLANKKHCHKMFCCCARWTENNRWSLQFPSTCAHPLLFISSRLVRPLTTTQEEKLNHLRESWLSQFLSFTYRQYPLSLKAHSYIPFDNLRKLCIIHFYCAGALQNVSVVKEQLLSFYYYSLTHHQPTTVSNVWKDWISSEKPVKHPIFLPSCVTCAPQQPANQSWQSSAVVYWSLWRSAWP